MTKKEYLLAILDRVAGSSQMALGLQTLIKYGDVNDETLAALVSIFRSMIKDATGEKNIALLEKASDAIGRLHQEEDIEREQELKDIDKLLENI